MLCKVGSLKDIERLHLKWIGQKKIDGVRCLALCHQGNVMLKGRSGTDYTKNFPEVVEELRKFEGAFDGEICCDTFNHIESRVHTDNKIKLSILSEHYPAIFYIFDEVIAKKPLKERFYGLSRRDFRGLRHISLLPFTFDLVGLWERAKTENWEGIVIKNPESEYLDFCKTRTNNWLKIKKELYKDVEFTSYEINSAGIRVEANDGTAIQVSGSQSRAVKSQLDEKGKALIEVKALEITENGRLRQPVFSKLK